MNSTRKIIIFTTLFLFFSFLAILIKNKTKEDFSNPSKIKKVYYIKKKYDMYKRINDFIYTMNNRVLPYYQKKLNFLKPITDEIDNISSFLQNYDQEEYTTISKLTNNIMKLYSPMTMEIKDYILNKLDLEYLEPKSDYDYAEYLAIYFLTIKKK